MEQDSQQSGLDVRVAILEERSRTFEEVLREALKRLEVLIEKSTEVNRSMTGVLTKHEERLDLALRATEALQSDISETKREEKSNSKELSIQLRGLEDKVDDLSKYRWIFAGVVMLFVMVMANDSFFNKLFGTKNTEKEGIERIYSR